METAASTPESSQTIIQSIPVDQIKPSRHQARKDFDEEGIKQLADSINKEGLLQPITVRRVLGAEGIGPSSSSDLGPQASALYELIAGERRLRAVKSLGWPTIEARVIDVVSEAAACAKGLVENLQRKDLNPIEEAEGFQELNQLDPKYWTMEEIGSICGKGKSYISQSLALLTLPEPVKEKVYTCKLSRSHAELLLKLSDSNKQIALSKDIIKNDWSVRETERQIKLLEDKPEKAPKAAAPAVDFAWKGKEIVINRRFKPGEESVQDYVAWLTQALPVFAQTPNPAVTAGPAVMADSAVPADPAITAAPAAPAV
jgi:ParB family chromosome partitioning protein